MWPETRSAHNARKEMNVLDTHITVAIDGPSGAGKSTIARAAARRFGLIYVDTGAIYRTVGLAGERAGIDCADTDAVQALLPGLKIELVYDAAGEQRMLLNGEDVSETIRLPEVSISPRACRRCRSCAHFCWTCSAALPARTASSWTGATSARSCCRMPG